MPCLSPIKQRRHEDNHVVRAQGNLSYANAKFGRDSYPNIVIDLAGPVERFKVAGYRLMQ